MAFHEAAHSSDADPIINSDLLGWGDLALNALDNLAAESTSIASVPVICSAGDAIGASVMLPKIEERIRSQFKFDEGWDCSVAERMAFGLSDSETLMIPQNMGNCVGDAHSCLIASRIAHEVLALGESEEPLGKGQLAVPFIPYTYGVGRLAGNMLGPRDGSYCGAQFKGTMQYGFLPCFTPGLDDEFGSLPQSSAGVGRQFGKSKQLIMSWADKAQQFDLLDAPACKSTDDAIELVVDKKMPLQICSGTMPTFWRFDDKLGIPLYRMGTPASHSTQIVAVFKLKGNWYVLGRNQWGYGAHKGAPALGFVGGTYVFPIEEFGKWLKSAECIAVGAIQGYSINPGI